MSQRKVRVALNGYGVIGKRIADAVAAQEDLALVGVADVVSDWRIKVAVEKGYLIFASTPEAAGSMRATGIPLLGNLEDLLGQVDVVADATPKKVASTNLEKYRAAGVKSIFQGGEKHNLTGPSFVAQANYETALGGIRPASFRAIPPASSAPWAPSKVLGCSKRLVGCWCAGRLIPGSPTTRGS